MNKENSSGVESQVSGVGQTANIGRSTSVSSGAAKVFREFKWGLLTLFLLMVVVVGLVYDGGSKKKAALAAKQPDTSADMSPDTSHAMPAIPQGGADPLLGPVTGDAPVAGTPPAAGPVSDFGGPPSLPPTPNAPINLVPNDPHAGLIPPSTPPIRARAADIAAPHDAPPLTPNVSTPPVAGKTYTVQSGETLSSIAQTLKLGKGGVKLLIAANKTTLPDPNRLKVGIVLNVPSPEKADKKDATAATPAKPDGAKVAMVENAPKADASTGAGSDYTVQSGDTLERIARKVFNDGRRWQDIQSWNRDQISDPSRLRVGQVLKIKQGAKSSALKDVKEKPKVSEADGADKLEFNGSNEIVIETPLNVPSPKESNKAKKEDKKIATSEKHDESKVEVMSATSSAFAP